MEIKLLSGWRNMDSLGMLHYFGVNPEGRHFILWTLRRFQKMNLNIENPLIMENKKFTISYSKTHWIQYVAGRKPALDVTCKKAAKEIKEDFYFYL